MVGFLSRGVLAGVAIFTCVMNPIFGDAPSPDPSIRELKSRLTGLTGRDRVPVLIELSETSLKSDPQSALRWANEARKLGREAGDSELEAEAAYVQGNAFAALGKTADAKGAFRQGARLAESAGCAIEHNKLLEALGRAHYFDNEIEQAIAAFEQALAVAQKAGDDVGIGGSMNSLGNVHREAGNVEKALTYFQGSLDVARKLGRMDGVSVCLGSIAGIHEIQGRYDDAIACYMEALKIAEESNQPIGIAMALHNLGKVSLLRGEYEDAKAQQLRANAIFEAENHRRYLGKGLANLGLIQRKMGDFESARASFEEALTIALDLGIRGDELATRHSLAILHMEMGDYSAAIESFRGELAALEASGVKRDIPSALSGLGEAYAETGDPTRAIEVYQRLLSVAEALGYKSHQVTAHLVLSDLYDQRGQPGRALAHHRRFAQLQAEIFNENSEKRIAEVRTQYDVEKKEREALVLKRENQINTLTIERQKLLMALILSFSALALIVILFLSHRLFVTVRRWRASRHIAHYRLEEQAGRGGSGVVYRATNMVNRQVVALKVVDGDLVDKTGRERFIQEGLLAETVSHPNVVQIFDRGEHNDQLYFAMEWLNGQTLRQLIENSRPDQKTALFLFSVLVDIVQDLHEQGIIHRDLKPSNIMLLDGWSNEKWTDMDDPSNQIKKHVKILDFGLAKIVGSRTITQAASFSGTLHYMAPENLFGQKVRDHSADWYALAVILYELLTGYQPFGGEDPTEIIRAILTEEPKPPIDLDASIRRGLSDFVLAMLEKDPSKRPAHLHAVRQRLDPLLVS